MAWERLGWNRRGVLFMCGQAMLGMVDDMILEKIEDYCYHADVDGMSAQGLADYDRRDIVMKRGGDSEGKCGWKEDYKDNYFAIGYSTDSSQQIRHNREKNLKNEKDEYTSQVETDRDSAPLNSIPTTGLARFWTWIITSSYQTEILDFKVEDQQATSQQTSATSGDIKATSSSTTSTSDSSTTTSDDKTTSSGGISPSPSSAATTTTWFWGLLNPSSLRLDLHCLAVTNLNLSPPISHYTDLVTVHTFH
ncbi:hypothetical protein BKA61DRAFT_672953 [Leptodontidium sp. MPI-SDFR-AT-0119]|nr:hypothetical protein BKA61DRAFT_672953 [Leptodontidium sp. MPI-SDFR-AT-0119]